MRIAALCSFAVKSFEKDECESGQLKYSKRVRRYYLTALVQSVVHCSAHADFVLFENFLEEQSNFEEEV